MQERGNKAFELFICEKIMKFNSPIPWAFLIGKRNKSQK